MREEKQKANNSKITVYPIPSPINKEVINKEDKSLNNNLNKMRCILYKSRCTPIL